MVLLPGCLCCQPLIVAAALDGWPRDFITSVEQFNKAGVIAAVDPLTEQRLGSPQFANTYLPIASFTSLNRPQFNFTGLQGFGAAVLATRFSGDYFYLQLQLVGFARFTFRKLKAQSIQNIRQPATVYFFPEDIVDAQGNFDPEQAEKAGRLVFSTEYDLSLGPDPTDTFLVTATPSLTIQEQFPESGLCPDVLSETRLEYGGQEFSLAPVFVDSSFAPQLIPFWDNYSDIITDPTFQMELRTVVRKPGTAGANEIPGQRAYRFYALAYPQRITRTAGTNCSVVSETSEISENYHFAGFDSVAMVLLGEEGRKLTCVSEYRNFNNLSVFSQNTHVFTIEWTPSGE